MQYHDYPYGTALKAMCMCMIMIIVGIMATCHAIALTITYEYTVTWQPNTEGDLAGYILEAGPANTGPFTVISDTIAPNVTSYKFSSTQAKQCVGLKAFDKSTNISPRSTIMCAQYAFDANPPGSPNALSVVVAQITGPVDVPDMANVKYTYTGRTVTFTWTPKDFETEIIVVSAQNTQETVLATVTKNQGTYTYTATAGDWRCHKLRHKSGTTYGKFALADPNNPVDTSFCMTLQ